MRRGALLGDTRGRIASDRPTGLVLRPLPPEPRSTSMLLANLFFLSWVPHILFRFFSQCTFGVVGWEGRGGADHRTRGIKSKDTRSARRPPKPCVTNPDPSALPQSPYKPTVTPRHALLLLLLHNRRRRPRSHYMAYLHDVRMLCAVWNNRQYIHTRNPHQHHHTKTTTEPQRTWPSTRAPWRRAARGRSGRAAQSRARAGRPGWGPSGGSRWRGAPWRWSALGSTGP